MKDEFYHSKEHNRTDEYKSFPAELYRIPIEENGSGSENAYSGKEITTVQPAKPKKPTEKKRDGLIDKIVNSFKGVATVSTVAVVAVVGSSAVGTLSPEVEVLNFHVESTCLEYEVSLDELLSNKDYSIVISTSNADTLSFPVTGDGVYQNRVEGLKPEWEYLFALVSYDEFLGQTTVFEKTFQTPAQSSKYLFSVSDVAVVGLNKVGVSFSYQGLSDNCLPELVISSSNGEEETVVPLSKADLSRGYAEVEVSGEYSDVKVGSVIRFSDSEKTVRQKEYSYSLSKSLDFDVSVFTTKQSINFYLKALSDVASGVEIVDQASNEILYSDLIYEDVITYYYDSSAPESLTCELYLTNDEGERISDAFVTTVNPQFEIGEEFVFNYKNPNDVGITYNEDGTMNVYVDLDFSATNEQIYYQVTLGQTRYKSQEPIFCALGIDKIPYTISYDVCIDVDGVQYSIYNVTPSGVVNEVYVDSILQTTLNGNTIDFSVSDYDTSQIDLGSLILVSSNGETITVAEEDWAFIDESYYEYTANLENDYEYVDVFITYVQPENSMDGFDSYEGSLSTQYTYRIYR